MPQKVGVIPFQIIDGKVHVLMVTSINRGRWVLPKGGIKNGEDISDACAREAFEEAGIKGHLFLDYPMLHMINSNHQKSKKPVHFFPMLVVEAADNWPEKDERDRRWLPLKDALVEITDKDIRFVLKHFKRLKSALT